MTAENFCVSFISLKLELVKMIVQNKFKEIFDDIGILWHLNDKQAFIFLYLFFVVQTSRNGF